MEHSEDIHLLAYIFRQKTFFYRCLVDNCFSLLHFLREKSDGIHPNIRNYSGSLQFNGDTRLFGVMNIFVANEAGESATADVESARSINFRKDERMTE